MIMEKQLSCARVRRYTKFGGWQSSATSDNVRFPRTMGLACLYGLGIATYIHHSCRLEYCQRVTYWLLKRKCVFVPLLKFNHDVLNRVAQYS